jgi:tRNA nucleotidyltransferase (CCA-adding enzyme)
MDEKTQADMRRESRRDTSRRWVSFQRGYETEEIFHEEDPLRVLEASWRLKGG